jgi:hypothetical protein
MKKLYISYVRFRKLCYKNQEIILEQLFRKYNRNITLSLHVYLYKYNYIFR